jgi:hypothetical protein
MEGKDRLLEMPASLYDKVAAMGEPVGEFTYGGQWGPVTLGFLILGGLAVLMAVFSGELIFPLILGGIPALLWLRTTTVVLANWHFRLLVFEGGLVLGQRDQAGAYFWNEVVTVEQQATIPFRAANMAPLANIGALVFRGYTRTVILHLADGEEIRFTDSLPRFNLLWEVLREETLKCLLPKALAAYHAGRPVVFGEVTVSREGLNNGHETLPWEQIKKVAVDEDIVAVVRAEEWLPWLKTSSSGFPNVHVFQRLVQEARRV